MPWSLILTDTPKRTKRFNDLLHEIRSCQICSESLEHGINPVLQVHPGSRVLIAGQAPGRRVHESGIPFDDPSGDRLRDWLGINSQTFYDSKKIAIVPMGFCFPGTGKSGDLPPRPECAEAWRQSLMAQMKNIGLKVLVGRYAIDWHLNRKRESLTTIIQDRGLWEQDMFALPHPSPRNNIWLKKNPWFEAEILPDLKKRVTQLLGPK